MGEKTGKISFNGVNSSGLPAIIDLAVTGGALTPAVTYAVVDTSNNTVTVLATPGYVYGVFVNTALSAHTVVIKDATAAIATIPASAAAGANYNLFGVYCATSIVVDPDDSSTGSITVVYAAA
jgi:hypothetical protein